MKVFISHKSEDMKFAEIWAKILRKRNFNIYFDKYDPCINDSPDRAKRIQSEIETSTDLLVIITANTQTSWWVPFEIGLSTANDIRIVSWVDKKYPQLPSFIRKWPIIDSEEKLSIYLEHLEKNKTQLLTENTHLRKSMGIESVNFSERAGFQNMRKSDLFHDVLLYKFGQI